MTTDVITEQLNLFKKDIETIAESLLEHISNLDDNQNIFIDSIVEGIDDRIREIVKEEIENASK